MAAVVRASGGRAARGFCAVVVAAVCGTAWAGSAPAAGAGRYDWPCWRGPHGNGSVDCDEELVDNLAEAKFCWQSEEKLPLTDVWRAYRDVGGGYCDPIVVGNRLYVYYYRPAGRVDPRYHRVWQENTRKQKISDETDLDLGRPMADDIVVCMDAATGRTLWRTVYPLRGGNAMCLYQATHWPHSVMCATGGKVFAINTLGRVFALDGASGKPLWDSDIGYVTEQAATRILDWLRNGEIATWYGAVPFYGHRAGLPLLDSAITSADGVLIVPDYVAGAAAGGSSGLLGFDADTGRRLWQVSDCLLGQGNAPVRWTHRGRQYVIAGGATRGLCIEPRSGKVLWEIRRPHINEFAPPAVSDDYVVFGGYHKYQCMGDKQQWATVSCYRITPEKAELAWDKTPDCRRAGWSDNPLIMDGVVYVSGMAFRLQSGQVLGAKPLPGSNSAYHGVRGRILRNLTMFPADPAAAGDMGKLNVTDSRLKMADWSSPTFSRGRLYYRTPKDGIVCYDLRKKPASPAPAAADPAAATLPASVRGLAAVYDTQRKACARQIASLDAKARQAVAGDLVKALTDGPWPAKALAAELLRQAPGDVKAHAAELAGAALAAVRRGDGTEGELLAGELLAAEAETARALTGPLVEMLARPGERAAPAACRVLAALGPRAAPAARALGRLVAGDDPLAAREAAAALAATGPASAVTIPTLLPCLRGKDDARALLAAKVFMGIGPAAAASAQEDLLVAFYLKRGAARFYVAETLKSFGPRVLGPFVERAAGLLTPPPRGMRWNFEPLIDCGKFLKDFGPAASKYQSWLNGYRALNKRLPVECGRVDVWIDYFQAALDGRTTDLKLPMGWTTIPLAMPGQKSPSDAPGAP